MLETDWGRSACGDAQSAGVSLRQEVFAHVPDWEDVKTGIEPFFAWVRVSIQEVTPKAGAPAKYAFSYKLDGPAIGRSMDLRSNLRYAWNP